MTYGRCIGTCAICGGDVAVPKVWMGVCPPTPTCVRCGAHAVKGPVIPMVRRHQREQDDRDIQHRAERDRWERERRDAMRRALDERRNALIDADKADGNRRPWDIAASCDGAAWPARKPALRRFA